MLTGHLIGTIITNQTTTVDPHQRGMVRPASAMSRSVAVASAGGSVAAAIRPMSLTASVPVLPTTEVIVELAEGGGVDRLEHAFGVPHRDTALQAVVDERCQIAIVRHRPHRHVGSGPR